jgi:hypothetical protein
MRLLALASVGAWLVTLLVALLGAILVAAARDSSAIGELAALYVPVMGIPFALLAGAVLLPLISLARAVVGPGRPWLLGTIGVAAAPVQAFVLLIAGRIVFQGSPHIRPTLAADVASLAAHPADAAVILSAFAAGGLALGVWAARSNRSSKVDWAVYMPLQPTRRVTRDGARLIRLR